MQFYAKQGHCALPSKSSTYNSFAAPQVSHKGVRDFCKHKSSKQKWKQQQQPHLCKEKFKLQIFLTWIIEKIGNFF